MTKNKIVQFLASIKITVGCLFLLFVLTLWGTIAQVDQGLYNAQQRFFYSWYFLAFDFLPFPGAQLVLWVLFINLALNAATRFVYKLSHVGIVIIHIGLLLYFVSAFVTFHVVEESNLTLLEGEGSNTSVAYHQWELSVWEENDAKARTVYAYDAKDLKAGESLSFQNFFFDLAVKNYYPNADAFTSIEEGNNLPKNTSGITRIASKPREVEPQKNNPGLILEVRTQVGKLAEILLFGAEVQPTSLRIGDKLLNFKLRRKRYPLPAFFKLEKFDYQMHPGTQVAKSYQSEVAVHRKDVKTDALIYMNHPLRYGVFTFYQASYSIDELGRKRSTLAVVKNVGRWLPYITSIITFIGLALHFILMGYRPRKKT